ncbi:MAG TPA: ABC transporter ATP-binding protein [Tepidimicrobium sp.]|nr:ABC transporter ATP-binding protein [Tepidimicrobium sp.]
MILAIKNLKFSYPSNEVLHNIEFSTKRGEVVIILGPNGTGKTTLLKCINRILEPTGGTILVDSINIKDLKARDLAKKIGYVEQQRRGSRCTVFDAVLLGRKPHIKWDVSEKDVKIAKEALETLNISHYAFKHLDELSGGELQKVIIARTLAQESELLLMDEPTNHLDLRNQINVLSTIARIAKKRNISVIITMHDINLAFRYGDKFIFMKDKEIYKAGGKEIVDSETIEDVYSVPVNIIRYEKQKVVIPI